MNRHLQLLTFGLLFCLVLPAATQQAGEGCTTAIIHGRASRSGAPILWKNRDTDFLSNKVIYVAESPYHYLALINAGDTSGRWAYAGLNEEGFAIINSVAYNLPKDPEGMKDLEGNIMAEALRKCRTIGEFEEYLRQNLGPSLGSWANYGVIDATGGSAVFEVHNHGYERFGAGDDPRGYLINSNFARSGIQGKGAGYLRFERAKILFDREKSISAAFILQQVARDFGHVLLPHPGREELARISQKTPRWILTRDTIDREYTASAVVIEGRKPGRNHPPATLWVILGEPLTSIAVPLWVESGRSSPPLWQGETAPLNREAMRIKERLRPHRLPDKKDYINATELINREGTGYLPVLLQTEGEILRLTADFLRKSRTRAEYAEFQDRMAQKALSALRGIKTEK